MRLIKLAFIPSLQLLQYLPTSFPSQIHVLFLNPLSAANMCRVLHCRKDSLSGAQSLRKPTVSLLQQLPTANSSLNGEVPTHTEILASLIYATLPHWFHL